MSKSQLEKMHAGLDGQLSPEARAELDALLADSREAMAEWESLMEVDRLLRAAPMASPRPGFSNRFRVRLAAERSRSKTVFGILALGLGGLGATASLMALGAGLVFAGARFADQPTASLTPFVVDAANRLADYQSIAKALSITGRALGEWGLAQPLMWVAAAPFALAVVAVWLFLVGKLKPEVRLV
ncbi:MAG: hypothetical protein FJ030_13720 [Chloroflexi bacterium]|nr:hypothetical protein [Chloroflexota bacterium]